MLDADRFDGTLFVFRNRRGTAIKMFGLQLARILAGAETLVVRAFSLVADERRCDDDFLEAHQLPRLIMGGEPAARGAGLVWRWIRTG